MAVTGFDSPIEQPQVAPAPAAAPTPAPAPAPAAPAPSDGAPPPDKPTGIAGLMDQMDRAAGPQKPPAPVPEVKSVEAPKPEVKPPAQPGAPKAEDGEPDWTKAPPKWFKIYEGYKSKTGETIKSLEAKIKSLETKPFEQPGDAAKLTALEKQLAEIRSESENAKKELARVDYTKSPEYKRDYVDRATGIYQEAVGFVKRLRVNDGEGQRPATEADFDYIRALPLDARRKAATEMFGDLATEVLDFTRDIDKVRRDAEVAVARHAETHERQRFERDETMKREKEQYDGHFQASLNAIKGNQTWGKWFADDPNDPEASTLLKDGYDEIENVLKNVDTLPPDQRAAYSAVWRARAAAAPRMLLEINRLTAKCRCACRRTGPVSRDRSWRKAHGRDYASQGRRTRRGLPRRQPFLISRRTTKFGEDVHTIGQNWGHNLHFAHFTLRVRANQKISALAGEPGVCRDSF